MKILEKIRQYAAVSSGNFARMFQNVEVPALPAATARLIAEINKDEPDINLIGKIISADMEVSAKVIRTVNSSLYGLSVEVKTVPHAIKLLGLSNIRTIALSYAMRGAIPEPPGRLFDQEAFWIDSLLRALLARTLAERHTPGAREEAFTVMLLSDVAIPVLLCCWQQYYAPMIGQWISSGERLSEIERRDFRWDHAQAGAWILKSWDFPEEIVCYAGAHNLTIPEIQYLGLENMLALPLAVASLFPSCLRASDARAKLMVDAACEGFSMSPGEFEKILTSVKTNFDDICKEFELSSLRAYTVFKDVFAACQA